MAGSLDARLGSQLGPYRIEAVVGRGGMGVVYRATDTKLDRPVALKLLAPAFIDDEAFRARFLRESKMAAAIDHPNIIPIYEAGELDGTYFLAMRYVDGTDLASRLRTGPLAPRTTVALLAQVAGALDAAHAAGLVHRDVKPANLLLASGHGVDRADHVYLTDFGLTKQRGSDTALTRTGSFLGTLEYVAPEQIEGKPLDGRADQYALAAIAVECLTGQCPFPRDSDLAIVNAHLRDAPPSVHERRADLSAAADSVIARGLAKDPDARYPDCQAFVDGLRDALGVTGSQPRPVPEPVASQRRRWPLLVGGMVLVGLLAAGAAAFTTSGSAGPTPRAASSLDVAPRTSASTPTAESTAFPNEAEARLVSVLPPELSRDCERGPYDVVESDVTGATPIASVRCDLDIASGANEILVRQFRYTGLGAGGGSFTTESAVSGIVARNRIRPGECATSTRASGRWELGGEDAGAIVCYTQAQSGDALLHWSYKDQSILIRAVNQHGDAAALYAFFKGMARFIAP